MKKRALFCFRRDLRLNDNRGLFEACEAMDEVFPVFVFDLNILSKLKKKDDARVEYIFNCLKALDEKIASEGGRLVVLHGDPVECLPRLASELKVESVYCNEDYEPYAKKRESQLKANLKEKGVELFAFKDQVIFAPHEVQKDDGTPYKVFTPYMKRWRGQLEPKDYKAFQPRLKKLASAPQKLSNIKLKSLEEISFEKTSRELPLAGEEAAEKRFKSFQKEIANYKRDRDFPALANTSRLSIDLRFGTLSIRRLIRYCQTQSSEGASLWMNELIWREFYMMVLSSFPQVPEKAFLKHFSKMKWPGEKSHFEAWKAGKTGYPLVDAAMRHFAKTGWMHNRLRMVVASFLVKDLLIDWKKGEKYFAEELLDFDLSANNGGWQWAASTGCDAQPYFRIFNPFTQSKRFDPDGEFIKANVPELKDVPKKYIHEPHKVAGKKQLSLDDWDAEAYPEPIVDHSEQRLAAIALFERTRKANS